MTYYGPFTIDRIESRIGDFIGVFLKPREVLGVYGPNAARPLYAIGCAWACGCESRGECSVRLRTSHWAPCPTHRHFVVDARTPTSTPPEERLGGHLVARDVAEMSAHTDLFEAVQGLL